MAGNVAVSALDTAALRLDLERQYGAMVFSAAERPESLSTGYPALDAALGIGGLPRGRIVELSGDGSGVLSLALGVLAGATREGLAGLIDPSRCFYPPAAAAAGVALPNLAVVRPGDALPPPAVLSLLLQSGGFVVVAYDLPRSGKEPTGSQLARLATQAARTGTLVLVLSASPTRLAQATDLAARPLAAFAAVRILAERQACLWHTGPGGRRLALAGYRLLVTITKHKLAAPGARVELDVVPGEEAGDAIAPDRLCVDPPLPGLGPLPVVAGAGEPAADRQGHAV